MVLKTFLSACTFLLINAVTAQQLNFNKKVQSLTQFGKQHNIPNLKEESSVFLNAASSLSKELYYDKNSVVRPEITNWITSNRKIAGDNPSTNYYSAFVSNKYEYKIKGNLGNALYVGVQVYKMEEGYSMPSGSISSQILGINENGDYELVLSAANDKNNKNWLGLNSKDYIIILREYYRNAAERLSDKKPDLSIENSKKPTLAKQSTSNKNDKAYQELLSGLIQNSIDLTNSLSKAPNTSKVEIKLNPKNSNALFPSKDVFYEGVYVKIKDDEMLEIKVKNQPACDYFSWTFYSPYYTTPNYDHTKVQLVKEDLKIDKDGNYVFYVAKNKLNKPNAIQTGQYNTGVLSFRFLKNKEEYHISELNYEIIVVKTESIK